jgi:CheY-like chemotaxis protein
LAFVRREVLQREVVNPSGLVAEVDTLLTRMIGEHIRLITSSSADLWPVEADPGQLEQVVVNLVLNARDAMPGGGVRSIETENFEVDAGYAESHRGLAPGRYVRLKVSDTGAGMAPSVFEHVFEPFFTTKPRGEGTGLGLPTVSAIVSQAGGDIQLYSECGVGTTCRVLLPATDRLPSSVAQPAPMNAVLHGTETVLVVEDADALREVTRRILASNGYRVLTSSDGVDALRQVECFEGTIDLLLTDVVMAVILGNEFADCLRALRPEVRVLYKSGYSQPVLGASLGQQVALLEKRFSDFQLLTMVRGVLDGDRRGSGLGPQPARDNT